MSRIQNDIDNVGINRVPMRFKLNNNGEPKREFNWNRYNRSCPIYRESKRFIKARVGKNVLSIGKGFMAHIGYRYCLAMMCVRVKSYHHGHARRHHHDGHSGNIKPQVLAFQFSEKLRCLHVSLSYMYILNNVQTYTKYLNNVPFTRKNSNFVCS